MSADAVERAKKMAVELKRLKKNGRLDADGVLSRSEKTISELLECVEYLSHAEKRGGARGEFRDAMMELRNTIWKVNDELKVKDPSQQTIIKSAPFIRAMHRGLKAIERMEMLLNIGRKC